jgi:hypothetical protein
MADTEQQQTQTKLQLDFDTGIVRKSAYINRTDSTLSSYLQHEQHHVIGHLEGQRVECAAKTAVSDVYRHRFKGSRSTV